MLHSQVARCFASNKRPLGCCLHKGTLSPRFLYQDLGRCDTSQGTYKLSNADVTKPVLNALQQGYRLIDTAQVPSATSAVLYVGRVHNMIRGS